MKFALVKTILFLCICWTGSAFAQQSVLQQFQVQEQTQVDDTLPIAPQRYDGAVEPPKDNFTSAHHDDMWEKYESGNMDEKTYAQWQGKTLPANTKVAVRKKPAAKLSVREVASLKKKKSKLVKSKLHAKKKPTKLKRKPSNLPTKLPKKSK